MRLATACACAIATLALSACVVGLGSGTGGRVPDAFASEPCDWAQGATENANRGDGEADSAPEAPEAEPEPENEVAEPEIAPEQPEPEFEPEPAAPQKVMGDPDGLNSFDGVNLHEGRTETFYSGDGAAYAGSLAVDERGFYRDGEGRYAVAASDMPEGTVFEGSMGECVVVDSGCDAGVTDYAVSGWCR